MDRKTCGGFSFFCLPVRCEYLAQCCMNSKMSQLTYMKQITSAQFFPNSTMIIVSITVIILSTLLTQYSRENGGYTTIKTVYAYDGVEFVVEVEVDAVQDHNAEDAILSAWGRRVKIVNGSLAGSNGILGSVTASPAEGE